MNRKLRFYISVLFCFSVGSVFAESPALINVNELNCELEESVSGCGVDLGSAAGVNEPDFSVEWEEGKCRFLDSEGQPLTNRWFSRCSHNPSFTLAEICLAAGSNSTVCGLVDNDGEEILPMEYRRIDLRTDSSLIAVQSGDKWGFYHVDQDEMVVEPKYDFVTAFGEGKAYVESYFNGDRRGGAFIDELGRVTLELPEDVKVRSIFADGLAAAVKEDEWGYIDADGNWRIPPQFYQAGEFSKGYASVLYQEEPQQWAVIDSAGRGIAFFEQGDHKLTAVSQGGVGITFSCQNDPSDPRSQFCRQICMTVPEISFPPVCSRVNKF